MADPREQLESVIQTAIDTSLKETHTCFPGVVQSFDPLEQTADIQPTIQRKINGEFVNMPLLVDVPIRFYKVLNFSITLPLKVGDEVEIKISERSIDNWLLGGGIQASDDVRRHSLSDAYATPMLYAQDKKITNFNSDNVEIRTTDKSGFIALTPSGNILLNGDTDSAIAYTEMKIAFDQLKSEHDSHFHLTTATVGATATAGTISIPTVPSTADMTAAEVPTVKVP